MGDTTSLIAAPVVRASIADAKAIHDLVNTFARQGEMLPRTMAEVYENLRDFYVVRDGSGEAVACGGLHILWEDLAEIKSLAVREDLQGTAAGGAYRRGVHRGSAADRHRDGVRADVPAGVLREAGVRAGGRDDAAAQGVGRVLSLSEVPRVQRDRDGAGGAGVARQPVSSSACQDGGPQIFTDYTDG